MREASVEHANFDGPKVDDPSTIIDLLQPHVRTDGRYVSGRPRLIIERLMRAHVVVFLESDDAPLLGGEARSRRARRFRFQGIVRMPRSVTHVATLICYLCSRFGPDNHLTQVKTVAGLKVSANVLTSLFRRANLRSERLVRFWTSDGSFMSTRS